MTERHRVFVSYSHADAALVVPVVRLLRANESFVFQDIDTIPPGKKWRPAIAGALYESHMVVVFWCAHARDSDEVSEEWRIAIERQKNILPLVLDDTPLPAELAEFQWIDFRSVAGDNHTNLVAKMMLQEQRRRSYSPMVSSSLRANPVRFALLVLIFVLLAVDRFGGAVFADRPFPAVILVLYSLLVLWTLIDAVSLREESPADADVNGDPLLKAAARRRAEEIERQIARDIETELLRRTTAVM